ncbi:CGNR zinc finger domain-containing protein [Streptomyces sp. NPDC020298]|uniref:CGNR zinc finger domain-containing protein n=1 Tax=unclassified Streptomyces TaxID=2593676 RepID=UPI0033FD1613
MALGTATDRYELRFDAGRICLDLLSTTHPGERLCSVEPLRAWITGSGLVPPGTPLAHADGSWLADFRELRGCVELLMRAGANSRTPGPGTNSSTPGPGPNRGPGSRPYDLALARLNEFARPAPPAPRAMLAESGALVRELDGPPCCAALLAAVARDAVELLTDPVAWAAVRECEGDNCPIMYVDTSRGRRRRWCSSEVCGNRERVARHRRRAALARA